MASLSLPQAGAWLNCPPLPALGLHLHGSEFVVAVAVAVSGLECPSTTRRGNALHAVLTATSWVTMAWETGGERIARHNALRDVINDTAASAGLVPRKEG